LGKEEEELEQAPSIITALLAGFLSFVSPCVLPLIPAYISFISGISLEELSKSENRSEATRRVAVNSVFFILGFSLVFMTLGLSASFIGQFIAKNKGILEKVAGVIIVVFGIHLTGLFRIRWLDYERKLEVRRKPIGVIGAFVIGLAFAFGWTPCIGPILAAILALAAVQETLIKGMTLLAFYSLGLAVPFFLSGLFINLFFSFFGWIRRHFRLIEIISGTLLIIAGILIFTGQLTQLASIIPAPNLEY
jgi:cytochrome c-type biogenesis protein